MGIKKNFVVKNGVEISTNLIYATNSLNKVGMGTTTPQQKLHVIGNILADGNVDVKSGNFTGILTTNGGLNVGSGGTVFAVDVTNKSIGINSTQPNTDYALDINVGSGQSGVYVNGNVDVGASITADNDITATGNITANAFFGDGSGLTGIGETTSFTDLNITGILTASNSEIYTLFNVVNNSNVAYQYQSTGIGFTQNTDDPILYVNRGQNYKFSLNASGYPFYIKTDNTTGLGDVYENGVEGNGTQVGIITFKVPFNAPNTLYYQASNTAGMGNTIYVLDESGVGQAGISSVGIQSGGTFIGAGTTLNFVGSGITVDTGSTDVIDIHFTAATVNDGTLTLATSGSGLSGSASFSANQLGSSTFTVTSNATDTNTGSTLVLRDSSGDFSAGTITASLSGTATNSTNINVTADESSASAHYVIFTGGSTGNQAPNSDSGLTYTPSSDTLTVTNISGTATNAVNATNATNINLADESADTTCFPVFAQTATGDQPLKTDASALTYNASTGQLSAVELNATSDINLKKDVETITNANEILSQINGVRFTWKDNDRKSLGVIAQEIESVLPELITERSDTGTKSVNHNGLIGVLIEAVKELSQRVEELENK